MRLVVRNTIKSCTISFFYMITTVIKSQIRRTFLIIRDFNSRPKQKKNRLNADRKTNMRKECFLRDKNALSSKVFSDSFYDI